MCSGYVSGRNQLQYKKGFLYDCSSPNLGEKAIYKINKKAGIAK